MEARRFAVVFLLAILAASAAAQPAEDPGEDAQKDGVRVTVGGGLVWDPKYPGADENRWRAIPLIGVTVARSAEGQLF